MPVERFVYILRFADQHGKVTDPSQHGLPPDMPKQVRNEVSFKDLGHGQTEVTVTEYDWPLGQMREMSKVGLEQSLDKMAASLAEA